jgi:hypothetical protein
MSLPAWAIRAAGSVVNVGLLALKNLVSVSVGLAFLLGRSVFYEES